MCLLDCVDDKYSVAATNSLYMLSGYFQVSVENFATLCGWWQLPPKNQSTKGKECKHVHPSKKIAVKKKSTTTELSVFSLPLRHNEISCLRESKRCFLEACERQVWSMRSQPVFLFFRACFYSAQLSFQPVSALLVRLRTFLKCIPCLPYRVN